MLWDLWDSLSPPGEESVLFISMVIDKIMSLQQEFWGKMHWRDFWSPHPVCPNRTLSLDCVINGYFCLLFQSPTKS